MKDTDHRSDEGRVVISAKVSAASAAGWKTFCRENAVSLAALLEVMGQELADGEASLHGTERERLVGRARDIDNARRARK